MSDLKTLRDRIAFWRREYAAFGHLSGETLAEMDSVAKALPALPRAAERTGNLYGERLTVSVEDGALVIRIGVQTLAYAVSYANWANPFDEEADDYIRTFAIEDEHQFAKDVMHAMLDEQEDGSTPLSDFIDKASEAAIEDGSEGLFADDVVVLHGQNHPCEKWANGTRCPHGTPVHEPCPYCKVPVAAESPTCSTCRYWDADGNGNLSQCNNPDSPLYLVYVQDGHDPWHEQWSCSLFDVRQKQAGGE